MQPVIYYCYDAWCGWCYGFSPVIKQLEVEFNDKLSFEVLSGGMIPADNPKPIRAMAGYISEGYRRVEEMTGVKFGADYLWHIPIRMKVIGFLIQKKQQLLYVFSKKYTRSNKLPLQLTYNMHYILKAGI